MSRPTERHGMLRITFRLPIGLLLLTAALNAAADCTAAQTDASGFERWKFLLSILGYLGALGAFAVGLVQYRRADYWKRSEFLAKEMKEYFADPKVMLALTMVDWGERDIQLFDPPKPGSGSVDSGERTIDRALQCQALRPHDWPGLTPPAAGTKPPSSDEMSSKPPSSDTVTQKGPATSGGTGFSPEQAAIRDCYDRFLDGFERVGNYLSGKLLSVKDLKPYVGYWVNDIADTQCDAADSLWCVYVFAYIEFYSFLGVQSLFRAFDHDIRIDGALVAKFVDQSANKPAALALLAHVKAAKTGVASAIASDAR
jgi:hypothetical protein